MNKFIRTINQQLCQLLTIALILTGLPSELFAAQKTVNKTKTINSSKTKKPAATPTPLNKTVMPAKTVIPTTPAPAPKKLMGLGDTAQSPQIISACTNYYPNDLIAGCVPNNCSTCTVGTGVLGTAADFCSLAICLFPNDLGSQQALYDNISSCEGNFDSCATSYIANTAGEFQDSINEAVCGLTSILIPQVKQLLDYWTALRWAQNQLVNMQVEATGTATWQQLLPNSALAINNYYVTKGQIATNQCTNDTDCADATITAYQDCVPVSGNAQNALGVDNSCQGSNISKNIWGTCNYTGTPCQTDNFCNQQKVCKFPDGKTCNSKADCLPGSQDLFCNKTNTCFNNQCTLTGKACTIATEATDCPPNPFPTSGNGVCMSKIGTQCYTVAQNNCSSTTSTAGTCSISGATCSTSEPCAVITNNNCSFTNTCIGTTCSLSSDTCSTVAPIVTCPANTNTNTCNSTGTTPGVCAIDKQLCCTATGCPTTTTANSCSSTTSMPGTCALDGKTCSISIPCATAVVASCAQSGQCILTGDSCTTNKLCPDPNGVPQCTLSTNDNANLAVLNSDLACVPIDPVNPQHSQQICTLKNAGLTECFAASPNTTDYFNCGITGYLSCQTNPDYPAENICLLAPPNATATGPVPPAISDPKYGCMAQKSNVTACNSFGLVNNAAVPGIVNQSAEPFLTSKIANAPTTAQYIPDTDVDAFTAAWQAMQINVNTTAVSQSPYSNLNPNNSNTVIAPQLIDPIQCGIAPGMTDDAAFNKMTVLCSSGPGLSNLVNEVTTAANFLNPVMYPDKTYNAANSAQNCAAISSNPSSTNGSQCPFVYPNNSAYYYNTSATCNAQDACTSANGGTCSINSQQPCIYNPAGAITCEGVTSGCILNSVTQTNTGTCYVAGVAQTGTPCCTSADCTCKNNYYCATGANVTDQTCVPNGTCVGVTEPCSSSQPTGICSDSTGNQSTGIACCFDTDCTCATQVLLCPGTSASCQQVSPDDSASPYAWLAGSGATPGVYINCLLPARGDLGISPAHPFGGPCPTSCQTAGTYCDSVANSTECSPNTTQAQTCGALGTCSVTATQTCMLDSDCPATETCMPNTSAIGGTCTRSGVACTSNTGCPLDNGKAQTCSGYCSINTTVPCAPETAATDCPAAYIGIDPTNGAAGTIVMNGSCVGQPCSSPTGFATPYDAQTNPGGISDATSNNTLCCNGTYCCQDTSCGAPGYCVYNAPGLACPSLKGDAADCIAADGTSATGTTGTVTCKTKNSGICNCNDIICTTDNDCTVQYTPQGSSTALTYTCLNSSCYNPSGNQGGGICQPNGPSLANTTPNSSGAALYDATYNGICSQIYHAGITLLPQYYNYDLTVAMRYAQAAVQLYKIVNSNTAITTHTPYAALDNSGLLVTCTLAKGATGSGSECEPLNLYLGANAPTDIVDPSGNILNMAAYIAKLQTEIMTLLGALTSPFDGAFTASAAYANVVQATTATCINSVCTFPDGTTGGACTIDPSNPNANPCSSLAINALGINANIGSSFYLPLTMTEILQNLPDSAGTQTPTITITPGTAYLTVTPTIGSFEYLPVDSPLRLGLLNVPTSITSANVFLQKNNCLNACCNADPSDLTCFPNGFSSTDNDVYCSCTLFSNLLAPYDDIPLTITGTGSTLYSYFTDALTAVENISPSSYTTVTNWNENGAAIGKALTRLLADYQILSAIATDVKSIGTPQPGSACTTMPPVSPIPPINGAALFSMIFGIVNGVFMTVWMIATHYNSKPKDPLEKRLEDARAKIKDARVKVENLKAKAKTDPSLWNKFQAKRASDALGDAIFKKNDLDREKYKETLEKTGIEPQNAPMSGAETTASGATTSGAATGPTPAELEAAAAAIEIDVVKLKAGTTLQDIANVTTGAAQKLVGDVADDLGTSEEAVKKKINDAIADDPALGGQFAEEDELDKILL